jgi:cell division protein FtsL
MSQADKKQLNKSSLNNKMMIACALIIFMHAFAIIICKDVYRRIFIYEQHSEMQLQKLKSTWGKLLLEYSSLDAPIIVSQLATNQLGMAFPKQSKLIFTPIISVVEGGDD